MTCNPSIADKTIPKPTDKFIFIKAGDTKDIINTIIKEDRRAHLYTKNFAPHMKGANVYDTCRNIWNFVKCNIKYELDPFGSQFIKTPAQTWKDKKADCKSYTLFITSILKNLGIPYIIRFASYKYNDPTVTHVYAVVPYQGGEIVIDDVLGAFNTEKKFFHKTDYKMTKVYVVQGTKEEGRLIFNKPIDEISEAEMTLLIAKQGLEIDKVNFERVAGIGNIKSNRIEDQLEVINDTLEVINDPNLTPDEKEEIIVSGIGGDAEEGIYSVCCNGSINGPMDRRRLSMQRKATRPLRMKQRRSIGDIGKKKTKVGKFLKKIGKGVKNVVKAVVKLSTAPARLAIKGILEATLPAAAPMFLYLFITDQNIINKLPSKMATKRRKAVKRSDFIIDKIGMKRDHFMGIVRNGISKRYGKSPEAVLATQLQGIAGVGILPLAAAGPALKAFSMIMEKIFSLFGGKGDPDLEAGADEELPDPALDIPQGYSPAELQDMSSGIRKQTEDTEGGDFPTGGRKKGMC